VFYGTHRGTDTTNKRAPEEAGIAKPEKQTIDRLTRGDSFPN
jgi:hypothetical protein